MLQDDARRLAAAIEERVTGSPAVQATVDVEQTSPTDIPRGAGRPKFVRYHIKITDGVRAASMRLAEAEALLDDIEPGCGPDQLFDVVRRHDVTVHDAD